MNNEHTSYLALPPGCVLDGYRVERVLGKGGFGITYLAVDTTLDMKVAVKELLPDGIATRASDSTVVAQTRALQPSFEWARERFQEEARHLARLSHPNVVRVQRLLHEHGTIYMVMEFVEGRSFSAWMDDRPGCGEQELMSILLPLLDGLEYVHSRGLLHRDIKPDNIFIARDGRPVLLDFGSAKADTGRTMTMTTVVSDGYSPFEQYQQRGSQGAFTDLYALAGVMIRAITGEKPANAPDRITDPGAPMSLRMKGRYSERFLRALDRAFAVDPRERPQSVAEFRALLAGVAMPAGRAGAESKRVPQAPAGGGRTSRRRLLAAAGGASFVCGAIVLGALLWDRQPATVAPALPETAQVQTPPEVQPVSLPVPPPPARPDERELAEKLLAEGDASRARGDYSEAVAKYREAAGYDAPDAVWKAEFSIAECLFERAMYREAERAYDKALAGNPEHPEALVRRAQCRFELNRDGALRDQDEALTAAFEKALEIDSSCWQALVAWGQLLTSRAANQQEERVALKKLLEAETLGAEGGEFHLARAAVFSGIQDRDGRNEAVAEALDLLQAAVESNPGSARLQLLLAQAYSWRSDSAGQRAAIDKAVQLSPASEAVFYARGEVKKGEDAGGAQEDYLEALALNPMHADALFSRAWLLNEEAESDQDYEEAINCMDRLLRVEPGGGKLLREKAWSLMKLKRHSEALVLCERDVQANPRSSNAYDYRADVLDAMDRKDEALADYTKAIELKPSATSYSKRGGIYYARSEYDKAIADYDKAIELDPKNSSAYNKRGNAYYGKSDYAGAKANYTRSLDLKPDVTVCKNMARACNHLGDYQDAVEACDQAARLKADDPEIYELRAKNLRALGRTAKAEADEAMAKQLRY